MNHFKKHYLIIILFVFFTGSFINLHAQSDKSGSEEGKVYLVRFTDKANTPYSLDRPLEFLSQKALERRTKHGITVTENDFPVNPQYLDTLRKLDAVILFTSRWMNSATIIVDTVLSLNRIEQLPFVVKTEAIYRGGSSGTKSIEIKESSSSRVEGNAYGESFAQINMLNGDFLHDEGYTGKGVLVAVIDAGFFKVDRLTAFKHLYTDNRIKGIWNFIDANDSIYQLHTHGTLVLSCMAARLPGKMLGTAPDANYLLLRSENGNSEYRIEEDAWIAAAEYADSAGADVINSSLGYSEFDNPAMNYTYESMDGNTARITRGADYAASKGMIVVTSAGNEGRSEWLHISAPADGDSVLSVGAVDIYNKYAAFSSIGPSFDGRVKPDVAAMGLNTVIVSTNDGEIGHASGTSLSAPVLAGLVACLVQAFPDKTNMEIIDAIKKSANQYTNPDPNLGYGIPDFKIAYEILSLQDAEGIQALKILELYPVPFKDRLVVSFFSRDEGKISLSLNNLLGQSVFYKEYSLNEREVHKVELKPDQMLRPGIYVLSISTGRHTIKKKIVSY